ncbi:hypothetical protein NX059_009700 [Plenodomus lindquistii]|nr:hypothetical protein NX059_009700 [Plenodomus lindquistii]
MLPKNLLSTYRQYKDDTDNVAAWLANTAKALGFSSDPSEQINGHKKEGKATAGQEQKSKTNSDRTTYAIPIKNFTILAEFIVSRGSPSVQVPARLGRLLDRAISTREVYSDAVSPHLPANVSTQQSADRHTFFLGVLKKVREILKPSYSKTYSPPVSKAPRSVEEVQNMFANLDVEEPSEEFQTAASAANTPSTAKKPNVRYTAEQPPCLLEEVLAIEFHLVDLKQFRLEVATCWESYKQGRLDLIGASIITNTAVDLARSMEQDLQHIIDKRGGVNQMLNMWMEGFCKECHTTVSDKEHPEDETNFKLYESADSIFCIPILLLSEFLSYVEPGVFVYVKRGQFGIYDPSSARESKTPREKFREDKALLMEMLPEFLIVGCQNTPVDDELTRGLRTAFETKKIPLWLAFALQLYLDIHNCLRDRVDGAFAKLSKAASVARSSIKKSMEFRQELRSDNYPKENDAVMLALVKEIEMWIICDPHRAAAKRHKSINIPEPYRFFRQHPWLCGLWKYRIQIKLHEISVTFANAWGAVLYCAHLYNAVRSEKLLPHEWRDMELAFAIQRYSAFFLGSPPGNPEDYLKRYALAAGVSVTNFATSDKKNGRKIKGVRQSSRGGQNLSQQAHLLQTFKERYCGRSQQFDLRAEDITRILQKSEFSYIRNKNNNGVTFSRGKKVKSGFSKLSPTTKVASPQLLAILRLGIEMEMLELSYDYLALHRFCWRLLRAVRDRCRDRLIEMFGPGCIEKEARLPFLVKYILASATNSDRLPDFMNIKQTAEGTSAVLKDAADVIDAMMQTGEGNTVGIVLKKLNLEFRLRYCDDDDPVEAFGAA